MKKFFKISGLVFLILAAIVLIMGLIQPKDITIARSVTIKAPQKVVFQQISRFKNWPNWSPWIEIEPGVKLVYNGIDGNAGSSYEWLGDETGSGKMTAVHIGAEQIDFDLLFIKPWEGHATGFLKAIALTPFETEVTWNMTMHADFPMNALGFMTRKMITKDFVHGLDLLKTYTELHPITELGRSNIEEKEFPATTFAVIRKKVKWSDIQKFSAAAFLTLAKATEGRRTGTACTFYYTWEDSVQATDMAPAFALSGNDPIKNVTIVPMPATPAFTLLYKGGYAGMGKAHELLGQYLKEKGRPLQFILEEYIVGPANERDSNKWVTNINYLVR